MIEIQHYCSNCGKELKATRRIYNVEFATVEVDEFDVKRCQECTLQWISYDDTDNRPSNGQDILVLDGKWGLKLCVYTNYKENNIKYEFWEYESDNGTAEYCDDVIMWQPVIIPDRVEKIFRKKMATIKIIDSDEKECE